MQKLFKKRMNRKGFTMLEIIAVVAVLAILLVVLVPRLSGGTDKSKELGTSKELKDFSDAAETMFVENSRLPGTDGPTLAAAYNRYIDDYFALDTTPANIFTDTTVDRAIISAFKSKAKDPFGANYNVVMMRDNPATAGITEKLLVFSNGKSLTTGKVDYALLMVYTDGKMSKCTVGFKSDIQNIWMDANTNGTVDANELYGYETAGAVQKLSSTLDVMAGTAVIATDINNAGSPAGRMRRFIEQATCVGK